MGVALLVLVVLPIAMALGLTVMGFWLLLTRKAHPAVALALIFAPTFAALWTFGGYRGLSLPLLNGDLVGMSPNLHIAGILLSFVAVQAALIALVRRGPKPVLAMICIVACVFSLAGPLLIHSNQRAETPQIAPRSAAIP